MVSEMGPSVKFVSAIKDAIFRKWQKTILFPLFLVPFPYWLVANFANGAT